MSNVQEVLDTQKQIEASLLVKMANFEKQLQYVAPENIASLEKLSQEFSEFKKSVWSIFSLLRSFIDSLTWKVDDLESRSRCNALLFNGIQENDDENCSKTILDIIQSRMGLMNIQATTLLSCHRLGNKADKKKRPILVRFVDVVSRNMVWREKKKLKASSTVIGEFLTKSKLEIFISARKHFGITKCWTQDGQVIVKSPNNDRLKVSSMQQLEVLFNKFPSVQSAAVSPREPGIPSMPKKHTKNPTICGGSVDPVLSVRRPAAVVARAKLAK